MGTTKMYVGNLHPKSTEWDLRELLNEYEIETHSIEMKVDNSTGETINYALVEMSNSTFAIAFELDGYDINDRELIIREYNGTIPTS